MRCGARSCPGGKTTAQTPFVPRAEGGDNTHNNRRCCTCCCCVCWCRCACLLRRTFRQWFANALTAAKAASNGNLSRTTKAHMARGLETEVTKSFNCMHEEVGTCHQYSGHIDDMSCIRLHFLVTLVLGPRTMSAFVVRLSFFVLAVCATVDVWTHHERSVRLVHKHAQQRHVQQLLLRALYPRPRDGWRLRGRLLVWAGTCSIHNP